MADRMRSFLGDSVARTVIKLLVVSFIVGVIMSAFHWYPADVLFWIRNAVVNLWETGFAALGRFGGYLLLGASIVVPAFIIIRLFSFRRS